MGPSIWQILIVLLIVLFVFGPKRIPGLGKSLGEAIRDFRKGLGRSNDEDSKTAKTAKTAKTEQQSIKDVDSV